ncbi:MAG: succinate--CoA ligase subunit alpha [Planctomycetota bacterium]|nr:succinate--CoA ligase subunit alpha [Planctomycetota bacterium]
MGILIDRNTRVLCQGITGKAGAFHAAACYRYGTRIVGGVVPGKGGTFFDVPACSSGGGPDGRSPCPPGRIPVFDTVEDAVRETAAEATMIFVPAPAASDAAIEAVEAGLKLIVVITEGIPALDMLKVREQLARAPETRLIGPNCPGIIVPGECKIGIMPADIHAPGDIGVVSRSGTLTYEAVAQITRRGFGQSACIGIGGDPITGMSFVEALDLFQEDQHTAGILMIGEIGGDAEERAAEHVKRSITKPVAAFVAGLTAPPGRRMGHAGAIISGRAGTAASKVETLRAAGIPVADSPAGIGDTILRAMGRI